MSDDEAFQAMLDARTGTEAADLYRFALEVAESVAAKGERPETVDWLKAHARAMFATTVAEHDRIIAEGTHALEA